LNRRSDSGLEPRLGDLEGLEPATRTPPHLRHPSRSHARPAGSGPKPHSRLSLLTLLLVAGVAIAAWLAQDRLRTLLPEPTHTAQLAAAEAALAEGRLNGDSNAALELFQQLLATDPDNDIAREGLKAVGRALLARARAAIAANQLEPARADFEAAQRILLGGDELDAVAAALEAAEKRRIELEPLLSQALAAFRAGRLSGANNAAAELYMRALRADPDNALAKRGLADVAAALGTRAGAAIDAGNARSAERTLAEIARIQPEWPGLPELRARLAAARTAAPAPPPAPSSPVERQPPETPIARTDVTPLLDAAEALLAAGRIDAPDDPNARALFERALALDPGNPRARRGLARIGSSYLLKARIALEAGDLDAAAARLTDAERAGADPDEVAEVALLLREIEESSSRPPVAAADPGIDRARVAALVERGERALARGDLVDPPGESAIDLFRAALALDGNDARARAGLASVAPRARALFEESVSRWRLAEAERQLHAFRAGGGSPGEEATMRHTLAVAWLEEAERLLFDGRIQAAERAVVRARNADPSVPGLLELESRLGIAGVPPP